MKKVFLLITILFISVLSTACINNFAVQELNNKAKQFMDKGDYASAIERLKSSIDLDGTLYETRYNLAVAYTKAEDYENAVEAYNEVIKLNPDFADAYYSRAVCEENLAKDIIAGEYIVNEDTSIEKAEVSNDDSEDVSQEKTELSEFAKDKITGLLKDAIEDYGVYSDKSNENVDEKINELQELSEKYAI